MADERSYKLLSLLPYALKSWYLGTATTFQHFMVFVYFTYSNTFFCNVSNFKKG
jgi:hypothetical protein